MNDVNAFDLIPRQSVWWLLLSHVVVASCFWGEQPLVIYLVAVIALVWRYFIARGRWHFPARLIKFTLVVTAFVGVAQSSFKLASLDQFIMLLLLASSFKLLETRCRRDGYIYLAIAVVLVSASFLYSQLFLTILHGLLACGLLLSALISLNTGTSRQGQVYYILKLAMVISLQALPLMIVLYLVIPRIAPLWAVPSFSSTRTIGLSDSIDASSMSVLGSSDAVAFRVDFKTPQPERQQLYWRGLVFEEFDGRRWSISAQKTESSIDAVMPEPLFVYRVTLEASFQPYLFAINSAFSSSPHVEVVANRLLRKTSAVDQRFYYDVQTGPTHYRPLPLAARKLNLELPSNNRRTIAYGKELAKQYPTAEARSQAILALFNQQNYYYTLNTPPISLENSVDDFLFVNKQGYCSHYAGAYVLLMRASGTPARLVGGYQGGELNSDGTLVVRQYDAHAWAEYWREDVGWQRVDPTAAIAPERVKEGAQTMLRQRNEFYAGGFFERVGLNRIMLFNNLQQHYDAFNHRFNSLVMNYDSSTQSRVVKGLLGEITAVRIVLFMFAAMLLPLLVFLLPNVLRLKRESKLVAQRRWRHLCWQLNLFGYPCSAGESESHYLLRIGNSFVVNQELIAEFIQLYTELVYGSPCPKELISAKERRLGQVSRRLQRSLLKSYLKKWLTPSST
ncbi:transglutaminase superfamily protein [Sinobacterium caligoides]|uniref:Transglutaminase superfamily protein n=1 Tax=Sinobacterium caligoides TaxID=933926 RepID=A0A3N2DJJ4_9GAMM|nr:DUF3488 and transglutaminase-like domain-containing protein [Sinobacterium caligoides]ROR99956.1 transglutaminase superfamily protein [Sinobacterium caligoides]